MNEERSLSAFLKNNAKEKLPVLYPASKRFVDDEGDPVLWELRCLANEEIEKLEKKNTKNVPVKGTQQMTKVKDTKQFVMDMTLASVIYPNLDSEVLQTDYEVVGAEALLNVLLTPGELADLMLAVNEANDFKSGMQDKIQQAKN